MGAVGAGPGLGESESKLGLESTRVTFFERLGLDSDSRFGDVDSTA
jgi:hypothetical protein